MLSAAIYGLEGLVLTEGERAFFRDANPYGYILFKRNCDTPKQLRALTDSLRELSGRNDLPILIDQEGGRVARLQAPHWRKPPAAAVLAALGKHAAHAVYLNARLIAAELTQMGITVDCAPLADIPVPGSHDIIGDRAYGTDAKQVVALAREMSRGLLDGGVLPVLKHIPGHGRARVDSHEALPVVDAQLPELEMTDFVPFRELRDIPLGMTAHIIYTSLDKDRVATTSPVVIEYIRNKIGFDGLLMSDDLSMKALAGSYKEKAEATLAAGCDLVLHCNGKMEEMTEVAKGAAVMSAKAKKRAEMAQAKLPKVIETEVAAWQKELDSLLPQAAA